jgi:hypothetical protein
MLFKQVDVLSSWPFLLASKNGATAHDIHHNYTQHNVTSAIMLSVENKPFMLSVIMLNVQTLIVKGEIRPKGSYTVTLEVSPSR